MIGVNEKVDVQAVEDDFKSDEQFVSLLPRSVWPVL